MGQFRRMWILVDREQDFEAQLYHALDGGLYKTKPIPAHKWLKPVRVTVTIHEYRRALAAKPAKAERALTPAASAAL